MKIYTPPPTPAIFRLEFRQIGAKYEYLTLTDTTLPEILEFIKNVAENAGISPVSCSARKTSVSVRERIGNTYVNGQSINVIGLTPATFKALILENLK